MNKRINYLANKLSQSFDGDPWYGESVIKIIDGIDNQVVNEHPDGLGNSIARLIKHMINWRRYVIEKLKGNEDFDIEINGTFDWPEVRIKSISEWEALIKDLKNSQIKILNLLDKMDDESLRKIVPRTKYNFLFLIEGIIRHDVYHLGQISMLHKMFSSSNK